MCGDLFKCELGILLCWEDEGLYVCLCENVQGCLLFVLYDGLFYVNGQIYLGYVVNKIFKDIIVKLCYLVGFDVFYVLGWDCYGLLIEIVVEKKWGKVGIKFDVVQFCQKCCEFVEEQIELQCCDFKCLGVIGDWDNLYKMLSFDFEVNEICVLFKVFVNGYIVCGVKLVYWCFDCGLVLVEVEIEYQDKILSVIDVVYVVCDLVQLVICFGVSLLVDVEVVVLIWMIMLWMLLVLLVVLLGVDIQYVLVEGLVYVGKCCWLVIVVVFVECVLCCYGVQEVVVYGYVVGVVLENLLLVYLFYFQCDILLFNGVYVFDEDGIGVVYIVLGYGQEDFVVSQQYGLMDVYNVGQINLVDGCGVYLFFMLLVGDVVLVGVYLWKVQLLIVDVLCDSGVLLVCVEIQYSYLYCWCYKMLVVFCVILQWFILMDKVNLCCDVMVVIDNVGWFLSWGKVCIGSMVDGCLDWCISCQCIWGVLIVLFIYCEIGELYLCIVELMQQVVDCVQVEGIDVWYLLDSVELFGEDVLYYEKVIDILDVWFDFGVIYEGVLLVCGFGKLADLYLEGLDQYCGWFQFLLFIGVVIDRYVLYKQCFIYGFIVDEYGCKMFKLLGNGIELQDIMKILGVDILCLWIVLVDYSNEMLLLQEIFKCNVDVYWCLCNIVCFLFGNLDGFDLVQYLVVLVDMVVLDCWIVYCVFEVQEKIKVVYISYNMVEIVQLLLNFCSVDLGLLYLDVIKDCLYMMLIDLCGCCLVQSVMYYIVEVFMCWIVLILSFIVDELWGYLLGECKDNVLFVIWYEGLVLLLVDVVLGVVDFDQLLVLCEQVVKVLELMCVNGVIGVVLEVEIIVVVDVEIVVCWQLLVEELCFLLISGDVQVCLVIIDEVFVSVQLIIKQKCVCCWYYCVDVGSVVVYFELCGCCVINIDGVGEDWWWF